MYHIFFIQSSVDGHLHCFHVLDAVKTADPKFISSAHYLDLYTGSSSPSPTESSWLVTTFIYLAKLIALSCSIHGTGPPLQHLILTSLTWFQDTETCETATFCERMQG